MATYNITGSNCSSFSGGTLMASSSNVGTTWDGNTVKTVVCRYHFKTDAYGATSFTFKTTRGYCDVRGNSSSDDMIGRMRFAIGTNATQYSTTKSSTLGTAITSYKYGGWGTGFVSGSSSTKLLPNTDYYLWVFPNASFASYVRFGIGDCTVTTSGSYGVASTITASNATLGNAQTITLTNTVSGVSNTLKVKYGSTVVETPVNNVTSSGTTYTKSWTPSISTYAPLKTDGKTMSVTLECTTKYGSATWGTSTKTITLTIPSSCAPDLSVSNTEYDNSIISSANIDEYVQGYSKLKATLATTLKYGASVSSYKIVYNGVTTTKSSSSATYTITTDNVVTAYDTITENASADITVADSRGFTKTVTTTFGPIRPYSKPVLSNINVFRSASGGAPADDGTYLHAYADASVSSVNGKNSIQVFKVFYRTRNGIFDAGTTLTSGIASNLNVLDSDKTYIAKITLQDKITQALNQPVEASFTIPAATWALKFNLKTENDKKTIIAAGIGKAPEAEKVLEIPAGWKIMRDQLFAVFYPVGAIYMSVDSTNPGTLFGGTWERITGRFLLAATDDGANGGNGNASIKPGYTGGEATHALSTDEMAAHTHGSKSLSGYFGIRRVAPSNNPVAGEGGIISISHSGGNSYPLLAAGSGSNVAGDKITVNATHEHTSVGSGKAHNNMPPYLAVYVWKRTA